MKKTLLYLLLLANLCSGLAFAWDPHSETMVEHDAAVVDLVTADQLHHYSDSDLHHDNHCCHGAAHLMGIIHDATTLIAAAGREEHAFAVAAIPFRYLDPHLRPPIV